MQPANDSPTPRPLCRLSGRDGNVYSVVGRVKRALQRAGQEARAREFVERAFRASAYDEVLQLAFEYVDVRWMVPSPETRQRLRADLLLVDAMEGMLALMAAAHRSGGDMEWVTEFEIAIEALDDLATNLEVAVGDDGKPTP